MRCCSWAPYVNIDLPYLHGVYTVLKPQAICIFGVPFRFIDASLRLRCSPGCCEVWWFVRLYDARVNELTSVSVYFLIKSACLVYTRTSYSLKIYFLYLTIQTLTF